MWLTTQSPPIENALHRIMRVIIFPHDDKKKRQVWIIISSKVPMCMQTHQLTTGPNGITSGFTYLTQDFQNPPVLCMIYTFRFDIFSYSGSLPPGTHFPYPCEQRTLPQAPPGVYSATVQILLSPWTLDFKNLFLLFYQCITHPSFPCSASHLNWHHMAGRADPVRSQFRWVSAQIPFLICAWSVRNSGRKMPLYVCFLRCWMALLVPCKAPCLGWRARLRVVA